MNGKVFINTHNFEALKIKTAMTFKFEFCLSQSLDNWDIVLCNINFQHLCKITSGRISVEKHHNHPWGNKVVRYIH